MATKRIPIRGMHCSSCEILVGENIKKIPGVLDAKVSQSRGEAIVSYSAAEPSVAALTRAVEDAGYKVGEKDKLPWISRTPSDYKDLCLAALALGAVYLIAKYFGLFDLSVDGSAGGGAAVALMVGLVAGVSTCMALVGGLVLGLSSRHAELHPDATAKQKFRPHLFFNLGRIAGYALLGGTIGLIGSVFKLSPGKLGFMTLAVGAIMIFFGLKLVHIFPALSNKSLTLPSGLARLFGLDKQAKEYSHRGATIAGALTFFLPCGFTQAMQAYAVSTGSFSQGALTMGLFALGTAPGLIGIGGLAAAMSGKKARRFFMAAGLAVISLGTINVKNSLGLLNLNLNLGEGKTETNAAEAAAPSEENSDFQIVRMTQFGGGYKPNTLTVKKGKPVRWIINSTSPYSCASSLVMPAYGINQALSAGENVITFTPERTGVIPFSCSMGMYRGKFIVTDGESNAGSAVDWRKAGVQ